MPERQVSQSRFASIGNTSQGNRTQDQSPDTRSKIKYHERRCPYMKKVGHSCHPRAKGGNADKRIRTFTSQGH